MKLAVLVLLALQAVAMARPPIKAEIERSFRLHIPNCSYCHVSTRGGAPWNPFGDAFRAELYSNSNVTAAMKALLAQGKDSDGDGYTDLMEVFAGSWPGDPERKPLVSAKFLDDILKHLGGVKIYDAP